MESLEYWPWNPDHCIPRLAELALDPRSKQFQGEEGAILIPPWEPSDFLFVPTQFANPFIAGSRGYIDDVIMPRDTRVRVCRSFAMLRDKKLENPWRKHGNIPL